MTGAHEALQSAADVPNRKAFPSEESRSIDNEEGSEQQRVEEAQGRHLMTAFCIDKSSSTLTAEIKTNVPRPEPAAKEALIRVLQVGICGTDLAMLNNYKPGFEGALGHEFVGVVERVGPSENADEWVGKRVVGEINIPCNDVVHCRVCRAHHASTKDNQQSRPSGRDTAILYRNHCPHRQALGIVGRSGAFAEYITLPLENLLVVPDNVSDSEATFTEPLAAAYRIIEQGIISPSDKVAVLGDGRLGLLIAEALAVEKAARHVTLIGKHREKLALVEHIVDAVAVHHSARSSDVPPIDVIFKEAFDVVVECTGTRSGITCALTMVQQHGGRIILKSTCAVARSHLSRDAVITAARKSVQIVGSRCGPFAPALAAIAERRVDVMKYLTAVYPLSRAHEAMAHAQQRGVLKVQLNLRNPQSADWGASAPASRPGSFACLRTDVTRDIARG